MDPSVKTNLEDINQLSRQLGSTLYLVGGTVRDHLIGKPCTDYDFTAHHAPDIARAWAQKIQRPLVPLDETPGHETFRVVLDQNLYFDFTTLQGKEIEDDLAQRDFTINAIAISLTDFIEGKTKLIDPFHGREDLHQKTIRVVRERAFEEDPLRLLRAFRFAGTLEFDIEPQTLTQIEAHRTKLNEVAEERVCYELLLLLGARQSRLDLMDPTGLIEVLFPGIKELKTKPGSQANSSQWEDSLNVFREAENILIHPDQLLGKHAQLIKGFLSANHHYALLKWSALIHLLTSAPDTACEVADFLKEFRLSNSDIQFVDRTLKFTRIVLSEARSTADGFKEDSTVYQFIHRSGNELISSLLLSLAVRLGNQQDIKYFLPLINRILDFHIQRYLPAQGGTVLLDGDVLKNKFQLEPSPRFKFILDKVEEARVLGIVQTPKEAEELAKKLISSQVELAE
jgi:tRNA nucleotidyltransferase/poly(A) polymerase